MCLFSHSSSTTVIRSGLLGLLLPAFLHGVQTGSQVLEGWGAWNEGEMKQLTLNSEGLLENAPALELVSKLEPPIVWSALPDRQGNLFIGTGNKGAVLKMTAQGEVSTLFQPGEVMSRALALDAEGLLYVGTSPGGKIYRVQPDGRAELYFASGESYIWGMVFDQQNFLYVACGSPAKIYRLPVQKDAILNAKPWFTSPEDHITTLAWLRPDTLLAGSSPNGILYRIDLKGQGFACFQTNAQEIRSIVPMADGTTYFSTFNSIAGKNPKSGGSPGDLIFGEANEGKDEKSPPKPEVPPPNRPPPTTARSEIYLLGTDGFCELVGASRSAGIYSLQTLPSGEWLAGTDDAAKIYQGRDRITWRYLQKCNPGGEVSLILPVSGQPGEFFIFTSNPAAVFRLKSSPATEGTYTSKVIDAGQQVTWGHLDLAGEADLQDVTISVRAGNTSTPDDFWTAWQDLSSTHGSYWGELPPARYVQCRLTLPHQAGRGIKRLRYHYQLPNAAPQFAVIRVFPIGLEPVLMEMNQLPQVDFERFLRAGSLDEVFQTISPRPQFRRLPEGGYFTSAWKVQDPNDDELQFKVELRAAGSSKWVILADGWPEPFFSYNTKGLADGFYQLRITADDSRSNRPGEDKSTARASEYFLVDNTPPLLRVSRSDWSLQSPFVEITVEDNLGVITDVSFSIDGSPPTTLLPNDDIFDSRRETFTLLLSGIETGPHTLIFQAREESGQSAILSVPFEIKP